MKKNPKNEQNRKSPSVFTCQLYKSRRSKTKQSNYKTWQIYKTTKETVKLAYHIVNFKKSKQ